MAPFLVKRLSSGQWLTIMRSNPARLVAVFDTQGEAIDHAYRNWPWWP